MQVLPQALPIWQILQQPFAAGADQEFDRIDCEDTEQRAAGSVAKECIEGAGVSDTAGPARRRKAATSAAVRAM
jgi:hypothetical protein